MSQFNRVGRKQFLKVTVGAGLLSLGAASQLVIAQAAAPATPVASQSANVDQLKNEAFRALRGGNFDRSDELLKTAATMSGDQTLARMSDWLAQYQAQRAVIVTERHTQYGKAVADVHKLIDGGKNSFAIDRARDAYVLSDDKTKFAAEPWVKTLVDQTIAMGTQYEKDGQWLKVLRVYSDLNSVDPNNAAYKTELKDATRHVRLLAMYTPDDFKATSEAESKERDAADAILKAGDPPTTAPTTRPMFSDNDNFKIDWHDTLKGVRIDMLYDALEDAKTNYWKDLSYRTLLIGGLKGLETVATTGGLEKAFPKLGDAAVRDKFLEVVHQSMDTVNNLKTPEDEQFALKRTIANLRLANRQTIDLPEEVFVNEFTDGAFAELDPFSNLIWPSELAEFNKSTQGEFAGVGIQIQLDSDLNLKVVSPLEDSPAFKLGIKAGDLITGINGKSAKGITTTMAVKYITGPAGSDVTLTIRSAADNAEKDYTIKREVIKVASVKGWKREPGGTWDYFIDPDQKIGYVRLTNFTKMSSDEVKSAVDTMKQQGARGMIFDLRYNPGGLLSAATEICDKFMSDGTIVSTRADRENAAQPPSSIEAKPSNSDIDMPIVVLVNQFSASASEIVSGALKDQHRAIIVGERTFGKGSVQMLFSLAGRTSYLKLTTSHYYLPSGKCIHREDNSTVWGVDPDVAVEMTPKQMTDAQEARTEQEAIRDSQVATAPPSTEPTTMSAKKDLLAADPQLSAALLVMRLKLTGATL